MNTTRLITALTLSLAMTCLAVGGEGEPPGEDARINGEGLVGLVDDPQVTIDDFVTAFNAGHLLTPMSIADSIESRRIYLFRIDLSLIDPAQHDAVIDAIDLEFELSPPPETRWVEFNYFGGAPEGKSGSTWVTGIADGDLFETQYSIDLLGVPQAHDIAGGVGTVVAVLDTGIDADHPAVDGKVLPDGYNFMDDSTDTDDSGDGEDNDGDTFIDEMTGHGTFVAGLITLIAPDTKLLPVVVLNDDGVTDLWPMVEGMFFAVDRCVDVINMSLTTTYRSEAVEEAILEARAKGIAIVAAAGNFDREEPRENPAMQSGAIGVAGTDILDVKASFSNFNDKLALSAPGDSVEANGNYDVNASVIGPIPDGEYAVWEGTSFATAFVSGGVALIRSQHPEWPANEGTLLMTEAILFGTSVNIDAQNPKHAELLGAGRLDLDAATAVGPPVPPLGDVTFDGIVDTQDLVAVILGWGPCEGECGCDPDVTLDQRVDIEDLIAVVLNWS